MVEHRLARLVQLGVRQARYFGRSKTKFQLYLAATVANLILVAAKAGLPANTGDDSKVGRDAGPSNGASLTEGYFRFEDRFEDRLEAAWLSADPASDLLFFDDLGLDITLEAMLAIRGEVTFLLAIVSYLLLV